MNQTYTSLVCHVEVQFSKITIKLNTCLKICFERYIWVQNCCISKHKEKYLSKTSNQENLRQLSDMKASSVFCVSDDRRQWFSGLGDKNIKKLDEKEKMNSWNDNVLDFSLFNFQNWIANPTIGTLGKRKAKPKCCQQFTSFLSLTENAFCLFG